PSILVIRLTKPGPAQTVVNRKVPSKTPLVLTVSIHDALSHIGSVVELALDECLHVSYQEIRPLLQALIQCVGRNSGRKRIRECAEDSIVGPSGVANQGILVLAILEIVATEF